jgi:hypothetical protein
LKAPGTGRTPGFAQLSSFQNRSLVSSFFKPDIQRVRKSRFLDSTAFLLNAVGASFNSG